MRSPRPQGLQPADQPPSPRCDRRRTGCLAHGPPSTQPAEINRLRGSSAAAPPCPALPDPCSAVPGASTQICICTDRHTDLCAGRPLTPYADPLPASGPAFRPLQPRQTANAGDRQNLPVCRNPSADLEKLQRKVTQAAPMTSRLAIRVQSAPLRCQIRGRLPLPLGRASKHGLVDRSGSGMKTTEIQTDRALSAFMAVEEVANYVSLSVSSIQGMVRKGEFPAPRQLGRRRVGWLRSEVDAWCLSRPVSTVPPPPNTGHANRRRGARETSEA